MTALSLYAHPIWRHLDPSLQQVLQVAAEPVTWSSPQELHALTQNYLLLGYQSDGQPFVLHRASEHELAPYEGANEGPCWRLSQRWEASLRAHHESIGDVITGGALTALSAPTAQELPTRHNVFGWLIALSLPIFSLAFLGGRSDALAQWVYFGSALSAGLWIWVLGIAPAVVGALLSLLLLMVSTHMPVQQALAGFGGGSVFLLLGIFGCSIAVKHSGLMPLLLAAKLRPFSHSTKVFQTCLLMMGMVMTLIIPSTLGRLQLILPMASTLAKPGNRSAVALAALSGCTLFSTSFLLGSPANLVIISILPEHWQALATWMVWFQTAAVYTATLLIGLLIQIALTWQAPLEAPLDLAAQAPSQLPPTTVPTLLALLALSAGAMLSNVLHIEMAWIALFALLLLLATDTISTTQLHRETNWPMLLYLLATVGIARSFSHMDMQAWLQSNASLLEHVMQEQHMLFIAMLITAIIGMRLLLPSMVCMTTFCALLIPMADVSGIHPLMLGFVIVTACEIWFFPHQSSDYMLLRDAMNVPNQAPLQILRRNSHLQVIRVLGLAASLPYWQHIGMIQ